MRHQADLLSDRQWHAWDDYFSDLFATGGEQVSITFWDKHRSGWDAGFWSHVNGVLFKDPDQGAD